MALKYGKNQSQRKEGRTQNEVKGRTHDKYSKKKRKVGIKKKGRAAGRKEDSNWKLLEKHIYFEGRQEATIMSDFTKG